MITQPNPPTEKAPTFALPSLQGEVVDLAARAGARHTILWFSRGFTCPFCRSHMDTIIDGYAQLEAAQIDVIQIAPNLRDSALTFFREKLPPYPFVCDPDKRLYARYGLGDRGVLEASKNTLISFTHAAKVGEFQETVRGSWVDVANRNFLKRLHHHALTAVDQGLFFIDWELWIRHKQVVGAIEPLPSASQLHARFTTLLNSPTQ